MDEIQPELRDVMRELAILLDQNFPDFNFALIMTANGKPNRLNFITNIELSSLRRSLIELIQTITPETNSASN